MEWSGEGEREGRGRAPSLLAIELRINMTLDSGEGGEGSRFSLTLFLPFFVWGGGTCPYPRLIRIFTTGSAGIQALSSK